jgi:hypothetical protein
MAIVCYYAYQQFLPLQKSKASAVLGKAYGDLPVTHLIDLKKYPLDRPESANYAALVESCKARLLQEGMFDLPGFLLADVTKASVKAIQPVMKTDSYRHARSHNIYFRDDVDGLSDDHPALRKVETVNHTLCADQLGQNAVVQLYDWAPFAAFLAATMGKPKIHRMDDPMARVNVQASYAGEALNWHFDRSEFTTTILLQAPDEGGELEYRKDLRSADDPNYEGVAELLRGNDSFVKRSKLSEGALNVFQGVNTLHRVVPVKGDKERLVAIFAFFDRPSVTMTAKEQVGFYGRAFAA